MRSDPPTLAALFLQFAVLSLFAVGGGGSAASPTPQIDGQLASQRHCHFLFE